MTKTKALIQCIFAATALSVQVQAGVPMPTGTYVSTMDSAICVVVKDGGFNGLYTWTYSDNSHNSESCCFIELTTVQYADETYSNVGNMECPWNTCSGLTCSTGDHTWNFTESGGDYTIYRDGQNIGTYRTGTCTACTVGVKIPDGSYEDKDDTTNGWKTCANNVEGGVNKFSIQATINGNSCCYQEESKWTWNEVLGLYEDSITPTCTANTCQLTCEAEKGYYQFTKSGDGYIMKSGPGGDTEGTFVPSSCSTCSSSSVAVSMMAFLSVLVVGLKNSLYEF